MYPGGKGVTRKISDKGKEGKKEKIWRSLFAKKFSGTEKGKGRKL